MPCLADGYAIGIFHVMYDDAEKVNQQEVSVI